MATEPPVSTKLALTPQQRKTLQKVAAQLSLAPAELLDILISRIALPLALVKEWEEAGRSPEEVTKAAVRSILAVLDLHGVTMSRAEWQEFIEALQRAVAQRFPDQTNDQEDPLPPYEWQPGEAEKGSPVRYVPGKGIMVEE
jgi:hypothetical protein